MSVTVEFDPHLIIRSGQPFPVVLNNHGNHRVGTVRLQVDGEDREFSLDGDAIAERHPKDLPNGRTRVVISDWGDGETAVTVIVKDEADDAELGRGSHPITPI